MQVPDASPAVEAKPQIKEQTLSVTIFRASGKVEEIGVVSYYHRNPLRHLAGWLGVRFRAFNRKLKGNRP